MRYLLLALFLAGCTLESRVPATNRTRRDAAIDSVAATLGRFRAAVATMDPEQVSRFYVSDTTLRWVENGALRYRSRADVAEAVRESAPFMRSLQIRYDHTEIRPLAPEVVSVLTDFTQKFTTPAGELAGYAGTITAVMVHRDSGWQFQVGHTSSLPRPAPDSSGEVPK